MKGAIASRSRGMKGLMFRVSLCLKLEHFEYFLFQLFFVLQDADRLEAAGGGHYRSPPSQIFLP
jgi:hypothetical protein